MATEATFTIPSDQFPVGTVFEQFPGATVELERIIPAQDVVIPNFWVRGTAVEDIDDAFLDHPGVENIRLVDSVADGSIESQDCGGSHGSIARGSIESYSSMCLNEH